MGRLIFVFIIILIFNFQGYSQREDLGLWTSLGFDKSITNKLDLDFVQELRLNENISELETAFSDIGLSYELIKNIKLGLNYRFIQKRDLASFYNTRHRFYGDITLKYPIHKFELSLRTRFQYQYIQINSSEGGMLPENYMRNRLLISYDINKRLATYLTSEFYYNMGFASEFDKIRYSAGLKYKLTQLSGINLYYLMQEEINEANPMREYIAGLAYTFSF